MRTFESHIAGRWQTGSGDRHVADAITGETIGVVGAGGLDLAAAHEHARNVSGPALRALTFHDRAAILRAVGKLLLDDTSELYALSHRSGATRADAAIDIDGGASSLLAYSGIGRRELPNSTVWPDGDVQSLSRDGSFVARHINVSRTGVAVQINAFNFPVWGMLEKFAPRSSPASRRSPSRPRPRPISLRPQCGPFSPPVCSRRARCSSSPATSPRSSACSTSRTVSPSPVRRRPPNHFARSLPCSNAGCAFRRGRLTQRRRPCAIGRARHGGVRSVLRRRRRRNGRQGRPEMHRHPQSDRARHPPRHRQRRPRRQTGGDHGRPSRRRRHRHGGPRRSGAASRCPRRRRRLGGPHGVRTGTLRTRHRTRRHGADTVARRRSGLVARSRRRAVRPGVDPPRLSGPRRCGCARRQGPRQSCRVGSGPTPTRPRITLGIAPFHGRVHTIDATSTAASTGHGSPLPQLVHGGPGRAGGGEELGGVRRCFITCSAPRCRARPISSLRLRASGSMVLLAATMATRSRCSSTNSRSATVSTRNPADHTRRHRALRPLHRRSLLRPHGRRGREGQSDLRRSSRPRLSRAFDGGWPVRVARSGPCARQLRRRQPPVRDTDLPRDRDPGHLHLQAEIPPGGRRLRRGPVGHQGHRSGRQRARQLRRLDHGRAKEPA